GFKTCHLRGFFQDPAGGSLSFRFGDSYDGLSLEVSAGAATTLNNVFDHFIKGLGLKELPLEDPNRKTRIDFAEEDISALDDRLRRVERALSRVTPRLRCFLSYRFGDANELMALRVQRFLALLGVEVVTGQSYEPRRVSDKIAERLTQELDFVVL